MKSCSKPALRLMSDYRLRIDEIKDDAVFTIYSRWLESVQARGNGKSASLRKLQSSIRAHLARIEKASAGVCRGETGQYWDPEPIIASAVQLGEKICLGRHEVHFVGAAPQSPRTGFRKRRRRKRHPKCSFTRVGEFSPKGVH
jgi:hypothetical protein